ncbi:MAG: hypothetical protein ACYCPP_07795 [Nitrososphaerales archaeon]
MYTPKTNDERKVIFAILAVSGVILFAIAVFYLLNPRNIVGDSLVNNANGSPEEFPPTNLSPFYVKPVTIMYLAGVMFAFCFFALISDPISKISRRLRTILLLVSLFCLAVSAYETLFNFVLWGSLLVTHPNPDTIVNAYPVSSFRINLVFATKSFVALLFVSYFGYATFKRSLEAERI